MTSTKSDLATDQSTLLQAVWDQAAVGLAQIGLKGQWLQVNQKLCSTLGYSRAELMAMDFQRLTHPDDLSADLVLVDRLLSGEITTYTLEKRYLRNTGEFLWANLTVSLVCIKDQPAYFISAVEISARARQPKRLCAR